MALNSKRSDLDIPTLESISPEYAALKEKAHKIGSALAAKTDEIRDFAASMSDYSNQTTPAAADLHAQRVAQLLGDKGAQPAPEPVKFDKQTLAQLQSEKRDLEAALEVLDRRIGNAARSASRRVCELVRDSYAPKAKAVIAATLALHRANVEYTAFVDGLEERGILWGELGPTFPTFAGSPTDSDGPVARFLLEAIDDGWLKKSDLPSELR